MVPPFDDEGYLPEGIHEAIWQEIIVAFGFNPWRERLLEGLEAGLIALAEAGCSRVYLDGSFVTNKEIPGDYDLCYETVGMTRSLLDPALQTFANGRAAQKAKFFGEYFPARLAATLQPQPTFLVFFQQVKHSERKKGIVALNLTSSSKVEPVRRVQ